MRARTGKRLALVCFVLLTPVVGVLLFAGAATYDGGLLGSALIVGVPLACYATGSHLVLKGLTKRIDEQEFDAA